MAEIVSNHPNAGERVVMGHLVSKGHRIARWRIRRCLTQVDPGRADRMKTRRIRRRVYSVPGPNSLWEVFEFYLTFQILLLYTLG